MRLGKLAAVGVGLALVGVPGSAAATGPEGDELSWAARFIGRQALPPNDGWAAEGAGTTGGAAADADHVFVVDDRAELIGALGGDNATNGANGTPKLIFVRGGVEGNVDDADQPLACADYEDPAYSLDQFLAAYDPEVWGRVAPSGPLEEARARSAANQSDRVRINVGSNTTIVGLPGAVLDGVLLRMNGVSNVIIRNIEHRDAHDCFPEWSPTDGATGNWNAEYDNIWVRNTHHVWIDHNTFTDADNPDSAQPVYFGRPYQVHDGQVDITNGADLVTLSFNRFTNHDKTMLIGSTNTPGVDVGRLRVTLHHNVFDENVQRLPRVRFGQVDVYNNYYRIPGEPFEYAWGVGVQSAIYAQNNFFALGADVDAADLIFDWGGTVITERGTWVSRSGARGGPANVLEAYNAAHDPDIGADAGWTPTLRAGPVLPAAAVPIVAHLAGANWLPM
jgi:pectate lyase